MKPKSQARPISCTGCTRHSPSNPQSLCVQLLLTEPSWSAALASEFSKPYFKRLEAFLEMEAQSANIYPAPENIFRWVCLGLAAAACHLRQRRPCPEKICRCMRGAWEVTHLISYPVLTSPTACQCSCHFQALPVSPSPRGQPSTLSPDIYIYIYICGHCSPGRQGCRSNAYHASSSLLLPANAVPEHGDARAPPTAGLKPAASSAVLLPARSCLARTLTDRGPFTD